MRNNKIVTKEYFIYSSRSGIAIHQLADQLPNSQLFSNLARFQKLAHGGHQNISDSGPTFEALTS
jgi:uncharacterized membrane protein